MSDAGLSRCGPNLPAKLIARATAIVLRYAHREPGIWVLAISFTKRF